MKPVSPEKQVAFIKDMGRCTGCKTCIVACKDKHRLPTGVSWRRVVEFVGGSWHQKENTYTQDIFAYYLSVACNHCSDPVCVAVCPTTAMNKDSKGIVSVDPGKCMGCRYCEWACPHSAPQFNPKLGRMTKCDFCRDYLDQGQDPSCVAACPNRALGFGRLEELEKLNVLDDMFIIEPDTKPCLRLKPHRHSLDSFQAKIANPEEIKWKKSTGLW
jgi:anaerobic dimethyl sulfoxide reductase subunit B (iron-sulfur subunit)